MPTPDFDPVQHAYTHKGRTYVSVTQVLAGLKLTPPYPETESSADKMALGTAIHKALELAAWDRLDTENTCPVILPYVEGFLEKVQELNIVPLMTEMRGVHLVEGYAGTVDLVCKVNGHISVIDFKSGSVPPCTALQTAGYAELLRFMAGVTTHEELKTITYGNPARRFSMQLTPGRAIVKEYRDPSDHAAWLGAVRLYRWQNEKKS